MFVILSQGRKSGECEPTVPRNIGVVPDSGTLESRILDLALRVRRKKNGDEAGLLTGAV